MTLVDTLKGMSLGSNGIIAVNRAINAYLQSFKWTAENEMDITACAEHRGAGVMEGLKGRMQ